jgi:shikimate kinase
MRAIYLTGFMGSGKTTIGRALSEKLGIPVIDTDEMIEKKAGKTIPAIFADEGEERFRKYEQEILKQLPTNDVIITTGGGMVISKENRSWMKKHGNVIFLSCSLDIIFQRLQSDTNRPLFSQNKEKMKELYEKRLPYYLEAAFTIDTSQKSVEEIVEDIVRMIKKQEGGDNG